MSDSTAPNDRRLVRTRRKSKAVSGFSTILPFLGGMAAAYLVETLISRWFTESISLPQGVTYRSEPFLDVARFLALGALVWIFLRHSFSSISHAKELYTSHFIEQPRERLEAEIGAIIKKATEPEVRNA